MTKPIPEGLRQLTPQISVDGAAEAIEFYKKAFGATESGRAPDPTGKKIWHAQLQIGDAALFVNDTFPEMGGTPSKSSMWIYGDDVDGRWKRALAAGETKVTMPIMDMFWGDRTGTFVDKWGIQWTLAQRMKNLTPEEMKKAEAEFIAQMAQKK
jgi:PhnB protein